jgi:hypothetical protein
MFISRDEKKYLFDQIKALASEQSLMSSEIIVLKGKLKAAEGNIFVLKQIVEFNKTKSKPKNILTAAQKEKQRQYQKAYNERQKAKKLAAQGNTNVSS